MNNIIISDSIKYIGVDDTTLDLFESQYIVPNGVSYNSYLILDEKIAVMDTVDARKTKEWFHYALVSYLLDLSVSQSSALLPLHSADGYRSS